MQDRKGHTASLDRGIRARPYRVTDVIIDRCDYRKFSGQHIYDADKRKRLSRASTYRE